jgi:hypothetical protein
VVSEGSQLVTETDCPVTERVVPVHVVDLAAFLRLSRADCSNRYNSIAFHMT